MNQVDAMELEPPLENDAKAESARVSTTTLNGLRGFLSIYIMVFHTLIFCKWQVGILGSVLMTFFFLISGFLLGIKEGKRQYAPTKCCSEACANQHNEAHFNAKHFWRRRMARTLPLFYLTNLMVIPLVYAGYHDLLADPGNLYIAYGLTLFAATTWLPWPFPLNGPSWFVSTMWFFYWIFPNQLPKCQRYTTQEKQRQIMVLFLIQLIGGMAICIFIEHAFEQPMVGFHAATFWPPTRLPVFFMGVFAGLLRNEGHPIWAKQQLWTLQNWKKWSDGLALLFTISFLIVGVVENWEPGSELIIGTVGMVGSNGVWMQMSIAWLALQFIVSLTFDEGTSLISKMLTSRVALECGRIGYAVYLVHEPIRLYLLWMIYGEFTKPTCIWQAADGKECDNEWEEWLDSVHCSIGDFNTNMVCLIPTWCVPVVWIVSIVLSVILNRCVEEPMRNVLRPTEVSTTELERQQSVGLTAPKAIVV